MSANPKKTIAKYRFSKKLNLEKVDLVMNRSKFVNDFLKKYQRKKVIVPVLKHHTGLIVDQDFGFSYQENNTTVGIILYFSSAASSYKVKQMLPSIIFDLQEVLQKTVQVTIKVNP